MKKIEELRRYFTKGERALWFGSVFVIIAAFYFSTAAIICAFCFAARRHIPHF